MFHLRARYGLGSRWRIRSGGRQRQRVGEFLQGFGDLRLSRRGGRGQDFGVFSVECNAQVVEQGYCAYRFLASSIRLLSTLCAPRPVIARSSLPRIRFQIEFRR